MSKANDEATEAQRSSALANPVLTINVWIASLSLAMTYKRKVKGEARTAIAQGNAL
jgi:hypothetical protein